LDASPRCRSKKLISTCNLAILTRPLTDPTLDPCVCVFAVKNQPSTARLLRSLKTQRTQRLNLNGGGVAPYKRALFLRLPSFAYFATLR